MQEKENLICSFSGGRTSAFMTWWVKKHLSDRYNIFVVFSNTGKEREETLIFVDQCDKYFGWNVDWIESVTTQTLGIGNTSRIVTFETASRNGEPFEDLIRKYGLPNKNNPFCSRDLKTVAINHHVRKRLKLKKFKMAIGIRADEPKRINWVSAKKNNLVYPLVTDVRTTKADVNSFWASMPFDLQLKSYEGNCDFCWKKSLRKLMTLAKEKPELFEWWFKMQVKYENHLGPSQMKNPKITLPARMFRENMSVEEIIEESNFPFNPAVDDSKNIDQQISMWNAHLDAGDGCSSGSCEPYAEENAN